MYCLNHIIGESTLDAVRAKMVALRFSTVSPLYNRHSQCATSTIVIKSALNELELYCKSVKRIWYKNVDWFLCVWMVH